MKDQKHKNALLEQALALALEAHRGQCDRNGAAYILHPLRVMCRLRTNAERLTAILHDVVEDSELTLADLKGKGFPEEVVQAVDCLTKRAGEDYETQVARAKSNPLARSVKLADLEDNMDVRRLKTVREADTARLERYRKAWRFLHED